MLFLFAEIIPSVHNGHSYCSSVLSDGRQNPQSSLSEKGIVFQSLPEAKMTHQQPSLAKASGYLPKTSFVSPFFII